MQALHFIPGRKKRCQQKFHFHPVPNRIIISTFVEKYGEAELLQEEAYYSFGMRIPSMSKSYSGSSDDRYLYNGKELEDRIEGFHFYDYGARFYDAALARWHSVDPLAEKFDPWTPYHYCYNNPLRFIDRFGLEGEDPNDDEQTLIKYYQDLGYDVDNLEDVQSVVNNLSSTFESDRKEASNPLNWTDGGYWNGSGDKPNVYSNRIFGKGSNSITYNFTNNEACAAWGDANDEQNLRLSTAGGILLALIPGSKLVTIPLGAVGAYGLGKFLNESCTNVFPGYSINYLISYTTTKSTHPSGENSINFVVNYSLTNEKGEVINKSSYSNTLNLDPIDSSQLYKLFENFNNTSATYTNPLPNAIIH